MDNTPRHFDVHTDAMTLVGSISPGWCMWIALACLALLSLVTGAFLAMRANFRRHPLFLAPDAPATPEEAHHPHYVVRATPPPADTTPAAPTRVAPPSDAVSAEPMTDSAVDVG